MDQLKTRVEKFGGSSLATAQHFRRASQLICKNSINYIVVSATQGTTDELTKILKSSEAQRCKRWTALIERHHRIVNELFPASVARALFKKIKVPKASGDGILAVGELWSALILSEWLRHQGHRTSCLDARDVLVYDPNRHQLDWQYSLKNLTQWRSTSQQSINVVTGFIARTREGRSTTLGRDGSDYSATLFANLLDSESVTIWTDVAGVRTCNPDSVDRSELIGQLSYDDAERFSRLGAGVLHHRTVRPVRDKKIPIIVRSSIAPDSGETVISNQAIRSRELIGLTDHENIGLIRISRTLGETLLAELKRNELPILMIGEQENWFHIALAHRPPEVAHKIRQICQNFQKRHDNTNEIEWIEFTGNWGLVTAVLGSDRLPHWKNHPFYQAFRQLDVEGYELFDPETGQALGVAVGLRHLSSVIRHLHRKLFEIPPTLDIALIGPGNVGATFLDQFKTQYPQLQQRWGRSAQVVAIANSQKMLCSEHGLDLEHWKEDLESRGQSLDLTSLTRNLSLPAVLIDTTASKEIAHRHAAWLEGGFHVITANKIACAGNSDIYRQLKNSQRTSQLHYETTVGAALPVLQTARDLVATGDQIIKVEGILSGSLSFLFSLLDADHRFSEIVTRLHREGYTEPDPRLDLSGQDVARKLVILGREIGRDICLEDVQVESLIPQEFEGLSRAEFFSRLCEVDQHFLQLWQRAREKQSVLRYVGELTDDGRALVRLLEVPVDHALALLKPCDNIVQFTTERYYENPLVIRGPGAGKEVTASGVFADLLKLADRLPSPATEESI